MIPNYKNVFHALTDVSVARLVTTVLNVDQTTTSMPRADYAFKFVVMVNDTLWNVMMEITSMVMDVQEIVMLRLDSHVMVDHQAPKTVVLLSSPVLSQLSQEDNLVSMERSC